MRAVEKASAHNHIGGVRVLGNAAFASDPIVLALLPRFSAG